MKTCGVRKNQTGAAPRAKRKSAADAAKKKRKRIGDAWIRIISAAIRAKKAAPTTPSQPSKNQPATAVTADKTPHQAQISESISGSLTKRRKYSPLSNLPSFVTRGSSK